MVKAKGATFSSKKPASTQTSGLTNRTGLAYEASRSASTRFDSSATSTNQIHSQSTFSSSSIRNPQRISQHIRSTIRTDYAPDICKDYAETGYCVFGDTCKFAHIRGDYKMGWELDAEWDALQKKSENMTTTLVAWDDEAEDKYLIKANDPENDPELCFICKSQYKRPVQVKECGHQFCEACFLAKFKDKKGTCPKCGRKGITGQLSYAR